MTPKFYLILLAIVSFGANLSAQDVIVTVPDVVASGSEQTVCVPVIVEAFPDVIGAQFSLRWDSTEIRFASLDLGDNPLGLNDMSTSNPDGQSFRLTYITSDGSGVTLDAGTVLFDVCFELQNDSGFSTLTFDGGLPVEFITASSFPVEASAAANPGSLNYGSTVATTVLPGDTDGNSQVDHRDLLNVGLLFGTTGPARVDASTNFTEQTAANWPGVLLSGINHVEVDADGNGTIDAGDLTAVTANYALENDGNFEFAPSAATPAGPALELSFPEQPDAGQQTTMIVALGDGTNPDAVGYALALTLAFDVTQVDMNTVSVDFANSFLGDDLLTIATQNNRATGIVEIALSRKDGVNTTTPGGELLRVTFTTIPAAGDENFDLSPTATPNAFLRADQTTGPIDGGTTTVTVLGASAVRTPTWATNAEVFPNPTSDRVFIRGLTATAPLVYQVFNRWGQVLRTERYNGRDIDLRGLPAGSYHIMLSDGVQRWTGTVTYYGE